MKLVVALCMFALLVASARAETAHALYVAGKFADAENVGVAEGGAAGFALAARAELAAEAMRPEPCQPCLERAEELARRAVNADPKVPEGQVELVAALGFEARLMGPLKAHFRGMAKEARLHIDAALAQYPDNAWALAALGSWNIEITRNGGSALARWLYGASIGAGLEAYRKAMAVAPDNLVVRYQYALSLSGYNRDAYRDTIESALARAIADTPQSAYEAFAQKNARELLAALKVGDVKSFDQLVRHDQGFP